MPIFEYNCSVHGVIERWVKFGEEEPSRCWIMVDFGRGPDCGKPIKKVLSRSNFKIKVGWTAEDENNF